MAPYYADQRKRFDDIWYRTDKETGAIVQIRRSVFGTTIRAPKGWSRFCETLFHKAGANGIWLDDYSSDRDGSLEFIDRLRECRRLGIERGQKVDLSSLAGNRRLEDLQICPDAQTTQFDLTTLSNLRRCQMPLRQELISFLNCNQLRSLYLGGGRHDGHLDLASLPHLEEFVCVNVAKLARVVLSAKVRLRSMELSRLKQLEAVEPSAAITEELRVVKLEHVPSLAIEWLVHAKKVECVALRLGEIPSIHFLNGLNRLQVLDLFGSKVRDGNFSLRDSLKGELDAKLWGTGKPFRPAPLPRF